MFAYLFDMLRDPNAQWILLGSMLLGLSSGVLGSFAYLRKQSLMGDALAHAALPGVCIAFMLTGSKSIFFFLIGAAAAGLIATFGIGYVTRHSRIKQDSALGIVLSVFFGVGIVLLTKIQHGGSGNQSGLDKFLFGQAASMVLSDVITMAVVALILVILCGLLFKEFKLLSFDPGFAKGIGLPVAALDQFMMFLIVVAVVVGIQAVGVVLMSALLITPAVSARYWTEKLGVMVVLSGIFGAISGFVGTLVSGLGSNLPTGPLSVLAATALFIVSVLFAPKRGLAAKVLERLAVKRTVLRDMQRQVQVQSVRQPAHGTRRRGDYERLLDYTDSLARRLFVQSARLFSRPAADGDDRRRDQPLRAAGDRYRLLNQRLARLLLHDAGRFGDRFADRFPDSMVQPERRPVRCVHRRRIHSVVRFGGSARQRVHPPS